MREIKFRAWNIHRSMYISIIGFVTHRNETRIWYLENTVVVNQSFKPSMIIIEQYTGLKDKNGKEIYEGDKWKRDSFIGIIVFRYAGWDIIPAPESQCISYPSFYSNADTGEIIGNIHEGEDK